MMRKMLAAVAAMALVVPATAAHAQEANWIHVRVDEADGAKVRVNLPATMVDVALDIAEDEGLEEELDLDSEDVSIAELLRLWSELKNAGDAEFVNVQDGDEHVRVFRKGDRVYVNVDEGETEKVRVQMSAEVADALLDSEGERLNVRAAVQRLAEIGDQELVSVQDTDATVRVWVDNRSDQGDGEGAR